MKRAATFFIAVALATLVAPAIFAQTSSPTTPSGPNLLAIAGAFGMAVAAAGCGFAQGRIGASACEGMARNPGASDAIRAAMILGLVFVETLALFTLVIIFTLIFK